MFNSDPGPTSLCGAVTALGGMSVYTSLSLKDSAESVVKQIPTLNQLAKPKSDVEEDEEQASVISVSSTE